MMDTQKALIKCMQLCSRKECCSQEIIDKLEKWEVNPDEQQKIIAKLLNEKFIDHNRFTRAFVNDKFKFNNWGKIKIRYHLKQKYIEDAIIKKHLNNIDQDLYENKIREEINKKQKSVKANTAYERSQKIARYVISKGFEPSIVFDLLKLD